MNRQLINSELASVAPLKLEPDQPWKPGQPDKLGFAPLAQQLATVLSDPGLNHGLIIGVEGAWGSGKSTLVAQTVDALKSDASGARIMFFNPWLVGSREALIVEMFNDMAAAVESMMPVRKEGGGTKAVKRVAKKIRKYAKHLTLAGKLLTPASQFVDVATGIPLAAAGAAMEIVGTATDQSVTPLSEQKADLEEALRKLDRRILVFVDDLDRLDPAEAIEVMRLMRAVGSLPNVVYVVCYDRAILTHNLETALRLKSGGGDQYLEKIIQASISVPAPEDPALREWLLTEALEISGLKESDPDDAEDLDHLKMVVDREGGRRLQTPRDVVRVLNSIKLVWPAIRYHANFGDLVWIQLIKLKAPELHSWIERYVTDFASIATSPRSVGNDEPTSAKLTELLSIDEDDTDRRHIELMNFIPGLHKRSDANGRERGWRVFDMQTGKIEEFIRQRRIGSPHHCRYYFALGQHGGSLPTNELRAALRKLRSNASNFSDELKHRLGSRLPNGQLQVAPVLDYIDAHLRSMTDGELQRLVKTLASHMDLALGNEGKGMASGRSFRASVLLGFQAMRSMTLSARTKAFGDVVDKGACLGWVSTIVREASDNNLNLDGLADAGQRYAARLDALGAELLTSPGAGHALWAWRDLIGEEAIRPKVAALIADDDGLLSVLLLLRGRVFTSEGAYEPLQKGQAGLMLDLDAARMRVEAIAKTAMTDGRRKKVQAVLKAFEEAKRLRR